MEETSLGFESEVAHSEDQEMCQVCGQWGEEFEGKNKGVERYWWEVGNKNEKSVYVVLDVHKWAVEPLCQNVTTSYHLLFSFWVDVTENTKRGDFLFSFCSVFQKKVPTSG